MTATSPRPTAAADGSTEAPRFPFEGDVLVEPDARYAELRADRPVCPVRVQDGRPAWLVTRYEDAKAALTDPRLTRGGTLDEQTVQAMGVAGPAGRMALIYADPPLLNDSRRQVSRWFNARRVERLRPRAQEIVDELIDRMLDHGGPVDLLADYARPLPITIICELLGIPVTDSEAIRRSVDVLMHIEGRPGDEVRDAFLHVYGYLGEYVGQLRERPGDDLLSDLIRDQGEGGEEALTDSELVGLAMLLFVTGHETTMTQIVNSCLALLQDDEQRTRLIEHPELLDTAVEELLRYVPLGHAGLPFAAAEDLELGGERIGKGDLGGERIGKGDLVFVSKLSANRDERAFPDAGTLDLGRTTNRHIAFSHGPHYCLGAALARMELQVALGTLFTRLPTLRLAVPVTDLAWRVGSIQRGPEALPVSW